MDFSRLPLFAFREIFTRNFNLNEKLRLRLVCKQWKQLIDHFGQENLAIWDSQSDTPSFPYAAQWPDSKKPINLYSELLDLQSFRVIDVNDDFRRIDLSSFFFQNLRRLCIFKLQEPYAEDDEEKKGERRYDALLNCLNELKKLNSLYFASSRIEDSLVLNLPELKFLCLEKVIIHRRLVLQTPNLMKFIFFSKDEQRNGEEWDERVDEKIDFVYPNVIKHVECQAFRYRKFSNLETLTCQRVVQTFNLENFPFLKQLSIYPIEEEMPMIKELKRQKIFLRRNSLIISIYGCANWSGEIATNFGMLRVTVPRIHMIDSDRWIKLKYDAQIYYYHLKDMAMYEELARFYPRMTGFAMPWHFMADYPNLLDCFKGSIPADFFNRYTKVSAVIVTRQVDDERKLIEFVRRASPRRLVLKDIQLDRSFYDQLASVDSIQYLTLDGRLTWMESDFISNMRSLYAVMVDSTQKFPLDYFLKKFNESFRFIYFGNPGFGNVRIIKQLPGSRFHFFMFLQYSGGNGRTFMKSYWLDTHEEFFIHKRLMENFVESQ